MYRNLYWQVFHVSTVFFFQVTAYTRHFAVLTYEMPTGAQVFETFREEPVYPAYSLFFIYLRIKYPYHK